MQTSSETSAAWRLPLAGHCEPSRGCYAKLPIAAAAFARARNGYDVMLNDAHHSSTLAPWPGEASQARDYPATEAGNSARAAPNPVSSAPDVSEQPGPALAVSEDELRVCIVGLGLMGGSLALAWRAAGWPTHVTAVNRSQAAISAALGAGAIDAGTTDLAAGLARAGVVVLATPVRTILQLLPQVGRLAGPGTLIMDLGSSKAQICASLAVLPEDLQVIGGHPLCGKETAGFAAADARLYRGRPFVLCPLPRTAPAAVRLAEKLARAAGARSLIADPYEHDQAVAAISHLPYALAATLVRTVAEGDITPDGNRLAWSLAASGFRDTSRLAASDVDMMLDILLTNRSALLSWIDAFAHDLAGLREVLEAADEAGLRARLAASRAARATIADVAGW